MPRRVIESAVDIPPDINRWLLNRCTELLASDQKARRLFATADLAGHTFTEKAPDMPWKRLNYHFTEDGRWVFDWDHPDEDTGETVVTYVSLDEGHRSMADTNYPYMLSLLRGYFKITPTAEHALKMAPVMPKMIACYIEALKQAGEKFNLVLPKWEYVGGQPSAATKIMQAFTKPFLWRIILKFKLWRIIGLK